MNKHTPALYRHYFFFQRLSFSLGPGLWGMSLVHVPSRKFSAPVSHHNKRPNTIAHQPTTLGFSNSRCGLFFAGYWSPEPLRQRAGADPWLHLIAVKSKLKTWSPHFNWFLIHFLEASKRAFSSQARFRRTTNDDDDNDVSCAAAKRDFACFPPVDINSHREEISVFFSDSPTH